MKKHRILAVSVIILAIFLSSCSNLDPPESLPADSPPESTSPPPIESAMPVSPELPAASVTQTAEQVPGDLLFIDESADYGNSDSGALVWLGQKMNDALGLMFSNGYPEDEWDGGFGFINPATGEIAYTSGGTFGDFCVDENTQEIFDITVYDALVATKLGLRAGDSIDRMVELYGNDFTTHEAPGGLAGRYMYEYSIGDHYFYVFVYNDAVAMWGIALYSKALLWDLGPAEVG